MPAELHDLSSFENVPFSVDPTRFEMGREILQRLQTYDPTARFEMSGDINAGEGGPQQMWNLVFDASKLPARPGGSNFSSLENIVQFGASSGGENGGGDVLSAVERPGRDLARDLYKEGLQAEDPVYGRYTDARNWKPDEQDWKSRLFAAAPMIIGGIATLGTMTAPLMAAAGLGTGAGAAAGETALGLTANQAAGLFRTGTGLARGLLGGGDEGSGGGAPLAPALQAILQMGKGGQGDETEGSSAGIPPALLLLLALASRGRGGNEEG